LGALWTREGGRGGIIGRGHWGRPTEEETVEPINIIDRGRGPELAHIRITVFDVLPYLRAGHPPTYIAAVFGLSTREVEALAGYIEDHKAEVAEMNRRIEERIARGNPPEVEARLRQSPWHAKIQARWEELRQRRAAGGNHEGDPDGRQHSGPGQDPVPNPPQ
jgi:hypothetical protein